MGNRVLLLLSIVMFLLFATALIIHNTITEAGMLTINTETVSKNIHRKEKVVEDLFTDSLALKTFSNVERYPTQALELTKNLLILS